MTVDLFITTGQSNAGRSGFAWAEGIRDTIENSGEFENPVVISASHSGEPLKEWYSNELPQQYYQSDFYNSNGTGLLQDSVSDLVAMGYTVRFRGLFWFQGEADGIGGNGLVRDGGSTVEYKTRWEDLIDQLDSDIEISSWKYVMNTVGNSGQEINDVLLNITEEDPRAVIFDTQRVPYRTDFSNIHGYDHYKVGEGNANLFISSFVTIPEPSPAFFLGFSVIGSMLRRSRKILR